MTLFASRKSTLLSAALLASGILTGLAAAPANAQISYEYNTILSLNSGTDTLGFDGANAVVRFLVPAGATYVERFNFPAVIVDNATVTFTGASVAANNGTFSLGATAFYPSFAGFFTEPDGLFNTVTLPVGGTLTVRGNTVPTASGNAVQVGDVALAPDFAPTTSLTGLQWTNSNGAAYNLNNTVITATPTIAAIPEPSEYAAMGLASLSVCGLMVRARRRRSNGSIGKGVAPTV